MVLNKDETTKERSNTMQLQKNHFTQREYEGGNQATLLSVKEAEGYKSDEWATFVQLRDNGKKLVNAKGKGVHLRTFVEDSQIDKKGKLDRVVKPIHFVVFNMDLVEEGK